MRTTYIVLSIVCVSLMIVGVGQAQTFGPFEDASGNDRDLTEVGNVSVLVDGPFDKFAGGVTSDSNFQDRLERTDTVFSADDGLSLTLSFSIREETSEFSDLDLIRYSEGGVIYWSIEASYEFNQIRFVGAPDTCNIPVNSLVGDWSLYVWHNARTLQQDQNRMVLYDENGVVGSCDINFNVNNNNDGTLQLLHQNAELGSDVWEFRFWDTNIAESTLDAVADPTNPEHALESEGTESALYFFEQITLPGDPDPINTMNLWTIHNNDGTTKEVFAQAMNQQGEPLAADQVNLFITRTNGFVVEYYNVSNDHWSTSIDQNPMNPRSSTLFNSTVPIELVADSTVRLTATAALNTNPQNADDLVYGDMEQQTVIPEDEFQVQHHYDISGLDHNHLIELAIWGGVLILTLFQGWYMTGFFSMIGVLRVAWQAQTGTFPIDFVGVLFFVVMFLWLEVMLPSWHERLRGWFTNS